MVWSLRAGSSRAGEDRLRGLAVGYAWARVGAGAAMFLFPGLAFRGLLGADASRPSTKLLGRLLGARDAALGAGALMALADADAAPVRRWMLWGAVSDAADAVSVLAAYRHLRRGSRLLVLLLAAAGAALGGHLWSRLD